MAEKDKFADEIISNEQLDNVAGGTYQQVRDDSRFLNSLNGSTERYGNLGTLFGVGFDEVKNAWEKLGIVANMKHGYDNEYFLDGQQITQEEARQHAMDVVGKQMTESDWNY